MRAIFLDFKQIACRQQALNPIYNPIYNLTSKLTSKKVNETGNEQRIFEPAYQ
jgi:hypothetical protein